MKKKEAAVSKKKEIALLEKPADLISQAIAKGGINLVELKGLMELQERWEANQAKKAYNSDMVLAQSHMPEVAKTLTNTHTNSKYAALDKIITETKPIYTSYGFSVSYSEGITDKPDHIRVCADVVHKLGHKESYFYDVHLDGKGIRGNDNMTSIHAKASSVSYGRRYLHCGIWNIATGDDNDGNVAIELISEEDKNIILNHLNSIDASIPKFLEYMKIEKLEDMPKSDIKKAMAAIENVRANKDKKSEAVPAK